MEDKFDNCYRISSARWAGYDYSQNGAYFGTICTAGRIRYFGEIVLPTGRWEDAELAPSAQARIAQACWLQIPSRFPFVVLDAFVVMPDHIHGILIFDKLQEGRNEEIWRQSFGGSRLASVRGRSGRGWNSTGRAGIMTGWYVMR